MPGIDALAPERTDSNKGFELLPNILPVIFSIVFNASSVSRSFLPKTARVQIRVTGSSVFQNTVRSSSKKQIANQNTRG